MFGLNVYAPELKDLDWMYRQYQQAAKHGHFQIAASNDDSDEIIKRNIQSVIEQDVMVDFKLRARAFLFYLKTKKVGFVVMSEIKSIPDSYEIHLFMVDRKRRGQGIGEQMLLYILKEWNVMSDIYARCFPASRAMVGLLTKHGFCFRHDNDEGAGIYFRAASRANETHLIVNTDCHH